MKEKGKEERKNRKFVLAVLSTVIGCLVLSVFLGLVCRGVNLVRYNDAEKSLSEEDYAGAYEKFEKLGYFRDSYERMGEANRGLMFNQAQELLESGNHEAALEKFEEILNLSGTEDEIMVNCENTAIELRYCMAENKYNNGDAVGAVECHEKLIELYGNSQNDMVSKSKNRIAEIKYSLAKGFFDAGQYDESLALFKEIDGYSDSDAYIARIATMNDMKDKETVYDKAISLMNNSEYEEAIKWFTAIESYPGSKEQIEECKKMMKMENLHHVVTTGVNNSFAIDLKHEVKFVGRNEEQQCEVDNDSWKNIVSLDCYGSLTIGLTSDNKVVTAGSYDGGKKVDMGDLTDIIDVTAGEQFVAALDASGSVYVDGLSVRNWDLSEWDDIIDIDAGWDFLVGLTKDHGLRFVGAGSDFFTGKYVKTDWENVISISVGGGGSNERKRDNGHGHVVGLKKNGRVIAIGDDNHNQCSEAIKTWDKVVRVSAGDWYTVGLTETGGVLITGENFKGSRYIDSSLGKEGLKNLNDIIEVAAGFGQTLCLRSNGTMYSFGFDEESSPNELFKTREWDGLLLPVN